MGNRQPLCERSSLSASSPWSMWTGLPPASRSLPLLSPSVGSACHSASQDSGSRFQGAGPLVRTVCKGWEGQGKGTHFTMVRGSLVLLGSYEGHGHGGRPGQEVQGSLLIGGGVCC